MCVVSSNNYSHKLKGFRTYNIIKLRTFAMRSGNIYLIWEREFLKTRENVYKIGRTDNIKRRLSQYPKGSRLIFSIYTPDCLTSERELIRQFRVTFKSRTDIGSEYFEGESLCMVELISKFVAIQLQTIIVDEEGEPDLITQDTKRDLTIAIMEYITYMTEQLSGNKIRSRILYQQFLYWLQQNRYQVEVTHTKMTRELNRLYRTTDSTHYFDDDEGVGIEHSIAFPYMLARTYEKTTGLSNGRTDFEELLRRCRYTKC
jgi:hypothetical protein